MDSVTQRKSFGLCFSARSHFGFESSGHGLELSMKDLGLIITPIDEGRTTLQLREYYKEGFWPSDNCHILRGDVYQDVKSFTFL